MASGKVREKFKTTEFKDKDPERDLKELTARSTKSPPTEVAPEVSAVADLEQTLEGSAVADLEQTLEVSAVADSEQTLEGSAKAADIDPLATFSVPSLQLPSIEEDKRFKEAKVVAQELGDEDLRRKLNEHGSKCLIWSRRFGGLLPECHRRELWRRDGFTDIYTFAAIKCGMSRAKVDRILRMERRLQDLPYLRRLFENGLAGWTKLEKVLSVATPTNDEFWAKRCLQINASALGKLVKECKAKRLRDKRRRDSKSNCDQQSSAPVGSRERGRSNGEDAINDVTNHEGANHEGANHEGASHDGTSHEGATEDVNTHDVASLKKASREDTLRKTSTTKVDKPVEAGREFASRQAATIESADRKRPARGEGEPRKSQIEACPHCGRIGEVEVKNYRGRKLLGGLLDPILVERLLCISSVLDEMKSKGKTPSANGRGNGELELMKALYERDPGSQTGTLSQPGKKSAGAGWLFDP